MRIFPRRRRQHCGILTVRKGWKRLKTSLCALMVFLQLANRNPPPWLARKLDFLTSCLFSLTRTCYTGSCCSNTCRRFHSFNWSVRAKISGIGNTYQILECTAQAGAPAVAFPTWWLWVFLSLLIWSYNKGDKSGVSVDNLLRLLGRHAWHYTTLNHGYGWREVPTFQECNIQCYYKIE